MNEKEDAGDQGRGQQQLGDDGNRTRHVEADQGAVGHQAEQAAERDEGYRCAGLAQQLECPIHSRRKMQPGEHQYDTQSGR